MVSRLITSVLTLSAIAGCSSDLSSDLSQALDAASNAQRGSGLGELSALSGFNSNKEVSQVSQLETLASEKPLNMPSPGRTNPFEIASEYENDNREEVVNRKREIQIVGFIELDQPSVMLSVDGKSHVVKSGEAFENITVNEVSPPSARITYDGVSRNISIFDRRSK